MGHEHGSDYMHVRHRVRLEGPQCNLCAATDEKPYQRQHMIYQPAYDIAPQAYLVPSGFDVPLIGSCLSGVGSG